MNSSIVIVIVTYFPLFLKPVLTDWLLSCQAGYSLLFLYAMELPVIPTCTTWVFLGFIKEVPKNH